MKLAINGFGRIGRQALRIALEKGVEVVGINDLTNVDELAHLFQYDSVYGKFPGEVAAEVAGVRIDVSDAQAASASHSNEESYLIVNDRRIKVFAQKDPASLPWGELGVDVVLECTGVFTKDDAAAAHIAAGAKRVVISAPAKGENPAPTFLIGVNASEYSEATIISNGSCTTNCISPVAKVLHSSLGITKAMMTTIHSVTADQVLVDGLHKDFRRGRSAMVNIVPTSTGAAISTTEAIPDLKGKFDGVAIRVPTICGSLTDFTFLVNRATSISEVNEILTQASNTPELTGILQVSRAPLVSSDIIGNTASAIVDLSLTNVVDSDLVKVMAWYDNEWGYTNRLVEIAIHIASV